MENNVSYKISKGLVTITFFGVSSRPAICSEMYCLGCKFIDCRTIDGWEVSVYLNYFVKYAFSKLFYDTM